MIHKDNILVVGDLHLPFCLPDYLDFCLHIQDRCKCGQVVFIGDLVDNHAISYHEHDPNGLSPLDEYNLSKKHLNKWFKAFPNAYLCRGNHDSMVDRKSRTVGLPEIVFRPFREIWDLPKTWKDDFAWEIDGVIYEHGTGYSGDSAHMKAAYNNRQSTVIGHTHSNLAGGYIANEKDKIFGVNCGCGVDRKTYAFAYEKNFKKKPIIGCAIVTDKGSYWQCFPMEL